ncbi:hypothetical protein SKAU_G00381680 [Synaphobranchus kaupii]|uniref:Uncharacterized protein n=1 Tax=Synaphobranchus kaupii TaxID=118154 RepID=A0A9Q1EDU0_SYNKA|nr:hypothetical protein SKAU_G00381680 [Synaphobranchus kaupii]
MPGRRIHSAIQLDTGLFFIIAERGAEPRREDHVETKHDGERSGYVTLTPRLRTRRRLRCRRRKSRTELSSGQAPQGQSTARVLKYRTLESSIAAEKTQTPTDVCIAAS